MAAVATTQWTLAGAPVARSAASARPRCAPGPPHVHSGLIGLHRTYLNTTLPSKTALKPDKAMLGSCKGGAVHLRGGWQSLVVCEGMETALSLAGGLNDQVAVWAALSTAGVAGLDLPEPADFGRRLLIGTDGDVPGRPAGLCLADRAAARGWAVEIVSAPPGHDFNVRGEQHA